MLASAESPETLQMELPPTVPGWMGQVLTEGHGTHCNNLFPGWRPWAIFQRCYGRRRGPRGGDGENGKSRRAAPFHIDPFHSSARVKVGATVGTKTLVLHQLGKAIGFTEELWESPPSPMLSIFLKHFSFCHEV